ncbi:UDP-3-O-acyl-N-acetylglucosamine deacetylase [Ponticoccus sp. SC2-23]|uniref:UDP-3-O-acyl-N-acetylglucosamine deacetylase n=1 Tax=Alexandriicola marinus TaxID=2081710 RepID=UPI000FD7F1B8|nr:UDP-3-O-acyl-N-acetylglucosamine deacetylase [Alexandriicola marinus]MBM1219477.1 UDP-3-O-acyl-N-acetylglucosamine deacetylase [Ponticoccus sp. SC6-9]MBM1223451.1 UDP-3-O-acyl-N-acetylglucosamine deacetylase [Ponticoccus sp. SC6-15]MBM1229290.1 UDP-3-O-acyl-N-acetylglucosamine deacetylase [Ponticoccus sp. SC6-38]MBM1232417.1 UDP-3-O-acyl-N-acetylglucosamine deacetylase [Ponticoccus sp. SC6-45]MBM1237633.1 UDP-3-O-acyl-N-acetylglucosamine deacetylase [Ponticoccus sp. SC6-49]MBM1241428.1 UDP
MQTTLASCATFAGTGLHSGRPAKCVVKPAPAGHGVVFCRVDVSARTATIPALWTHVRATALNTRIGNADGIEVSTVEHLLAALAGCGVHNARVELHGPELPALDGSAARFVRGVMDAGIKRLAAPLDVIEVTSPITVSSGDAWARLTPSDALEIDLTIDFPDAAIGRQQKVLDLGNGTFVRELCDSRTFCRQSDIEHMRRQGLALGGTYDNAVVYDGAGVLNPGGLRHKDEAVRHKMLDVMGDLSLAGYPLLGRYEGYKSGHAMTHRLVEALLSDPSAHRLRRCDDGLAKRLPGAGLVAADLAAVA